MSKKGNRNVSTGDILYFVDYWGTENGTQAFEARGEVLNINNKNKTFVAVLYGDTYQTYSFNDYGRLFFDTQKEAMIAADNLPKHNDVVYQDIHGRFYKKTVAGIFGYNTENNTYDLRLLLNRGNPVSIKEIGKTIFMKKPEKRQ